MVKMLSDTNPVLTLRSDHEAMRLAAHGAETRQAASLRMPGAMSERDPYYSTGPTRHTAQGSVTRSSPPLNPGIR